MFNRIRARFHRPEGDWDPVPASHAAQYAKEAWESGVRGVKLDLIDELEGWIGGFEGKRVLDLGGGPGHYGVAFAQRGAQVTWHDVSRRYGEVVKEKASECGVKIHVSLGYMDEAVDILNEQYDLVFNRICWYYCFSDRSFSKVIYSLTKPGGFGFVDTPHSGCDRRNSSISKRMRTWLNDAVAIKIGYPFPTRGRIARLFSEFSCRIIVDRQSATNDQVLFQRPIE